MKMELILLGLVLLVMMMSWPCTVWAEDKEVGEFEIPAVQPLDEKAQDRLRAFVQTDAEATSVVAQILSEGRPLLDAQPHPLKVVHYEGLVNTDPRRIATVAKLREMGDVARLMRYWQVTGDEKAAETLERFVVAWTGTYLLTGNDVNENKFYPLLVAYFALRDQMAPEETESVDLWVEQLGELHLKAVNQSEKFTNRYAKSVRLLAICGVILQRRAWIDNAQEGIKRFVDESLYADGSSEDLKRRDTLTYHGSALKPVIELAMLLGRDGVHLYDWEGDKAGSIRKSVDYVVPYALGEKVREEWRNSKVGLDRRRAEAGLEKYRAGRLYEPKNALELMELAHYFDPALLRVVTHLTESDAKRFPTWQILINRAMQNDMQGH